MYIYLHICIYIYIYTYLSHSLSLYIYIYICIHTRPGQDLGKVREVAACVGSGVRLLISYLVIELLSVD